MKQAIPLPKSSSSITYEQLGYLESFDAVVDKLYAFLVYKETRSSNNKWVVRIKGSVVAGTVFDPENRSLENAIRKELAHGNEYLVWGFNLVPKDQDPRLVENRLFFDENGEMTKIELHLITRDPDNNGLPEKVLEVSWPGADAQNVDGDNDFKAFYDKYEAACREKDEGFIKQLLPDDIPADELGFVLDMSQQTALSLDKSGVKPTFSQSGNRMDVIYKGDLGDGMTEMTLDFYFYNDQWLKYNPG